MKELLQQYAAFNCWANQRITEVILKLDENTQQQIVASSFPNLYATVLHIWDAESAWWQRIKLHEKILMPSETFNPTMQEVVNGLQQQDRMWEEWINNATVPALEHVVAYQNTKREQFKQPVFQIILHVFNHSTYHRGQLVTMLRALGADKIPPMDFSVWCRKKLYAH